MYQALLAKLARALDTGKIPYMVIGGQAVLFHGEPRLTRDVDITLGLDATGLEKVRLAIEGTDLVPSVPDVEAFVRSTNVFPLSEPSSGIRVDLIFSFTPYEALAIDRAVTATFNTVPVRFASAEDLIIHKLVAGRPRDIEDVVGVLARRPTLDEGYLIHWLASFREIVSRDLVSQFRSLTEHRDA